MKTGINKVAMKDKKEGISLLVLIITIIVMVILAGAVILSITGNNPISRANETKVKTDLTALKDEYNNFYSSALFDNVSNTKGYYTDKMNITKEGNIIYKGKIVNEGENNSLASIMPSIVGTEYEGKVFVADGKIYIDNRDKFLSEEQQEWAKEVGINILNEGEVLVLSTEEVSLKISQKERIYATVLPDTDSQVEFEIDEQTKARIIEEKENTVDIQGISDGVAILTAKVTAKDGVEIEKKVTVKVNVGDYIKVEKITIDPSEVELGLDESAQLRAIITPETADNQDVSWEVESQSPDNAVDLSQTGEVTGRDVGTATIIAKGEYGNYTSDVCSVSVIDKTTITLDKQTLQLRKGQKDTLKATVENGNKREGTLTWETSDDAKVGVDQEGNITAKEVGSATITAKYLTKSVTCQVEVLDPLELSAEVTEARGTKATLKISANTTYDQIEKIEIQHREKGKEDWVTDPSIDVNRTEYNTNDYVINGLEPRKIFEIEVVATLKDKSCQKKVSLQTEPTWIPVESVTLNKDTTKLVLGETETLTATVLPEDASDKTVIWESSAQDKAIVNEGVITTTGVGNTTITAKARDNENKKDVCQVEVTEPITIDASVNKEGITSSSIPVKVKTSTEHGTLAKITIRYKKTSENNNWQEKEVIDGVSGQINYDDTIIIEGLKDETQYDIEVKVEISSKTSNYANGHSVTQSGLSGTTLKIPVNSVSLSPTSIKIPLGNTENIQATIQPNNATHQGLTWTSEPSNIVDIQGDDTAKEGKANATITAKQMQKTNVTVTSTDEPSVSAQCSVEVTEPISLTAIISGEKTDEVIPVSIKTSTKHGKISKVEVLYKKKDTQDEYVTENVDIQSGQTEYEGTYKIEGLAPFTEYNIQVRVTIISDVIGEHSLTTNDLPGKTLKRDVTGLTLSPKTLEIPLGEDTHILQATITPDDATNKGVDWDSTNKDVATVEGGKITTKSIGQTTITATSQDNKDAKDTCQVNVIEPIDIQASIDENGITSSKIPVKINTTTKVGTISNVQVKYKAKNANTDTWTVKSVSDIEANAKSYNKTYTIDSGLNPYTEYEIEVTVTISTRHSYTQKGLKATTKKIDVTKLTLSPKTLEIPLGDNTQIITATITPENATNKNVSWSSSKTEVANVSGGTITTSSIGQAIITAKSQDNESISDTCTVNVVEPITLDASTGTTTSSEIPVEITTSTKYGTLSKIDIKYKKSGTANWTTKTLTTTEIGANKTSYSNTYTIDSGLEPNTTYEIEVTVTISTNHTYTKNRISGTTKKIRVTSVSLNESTTTIALGNSEQLTATVMPENATDKTLKWSSDKPNVANVDNNGKVTTSVTGEIGQATITVQSQDNISAKATCVVTTVEPIDLQASLGTITSNKIPVKIDASTQYGTITGIQVKYRENPSGNWQTKIVSITTGRTTYNGTYDITEGVTPDTKYDIKVIVTITGDRTKTADLVASSLKIDVTSVSLNNNNLEIALGNTAQLKATITPTNATKQGLSWSSSPQNKVEITGGTTATSGEATATITAKDIGSTTVTVASTDNSQATAQCSVNVIEPIKVTASVVSSGITTDTIPVSIDASTLHGNISKIEVMYKKSTDSNYATKTINNINSDKYTTSNYQITGLTPNTTYNIQVKVTITSSTITSRSKTVENLTGTTNKIDVTSITLSPTSKEIIYGEEENFKITATVLPANATNKGINWSTNANSVATVDTGGKVTIKGVGKATITATSQDKSSVTARCTVTVLEASAKVNEPELYPGMTAIKFDSSGNPQETTSDDEDWYSYTSQGTYGKDGKTSRWANAKTVDGSQWVWIPRYAYKIANPYTSDASEIDIKFMKGTSSTEYIDTDGSVKTLTPDYIVHPAFRDETGNGFANGGWDSELTGIWVAKYEASKNTSVGNESTSEKAYPKFVPSVNSYTSIKIGDIFTLCKNLNQSGNPYGFSSSTADTHQMKNSEWGAVAYLAQSKYGRNGVEVQQNNADYKTGYGASTSDTYSTQSGQLASTTGNIYGIYDMSGGASEYTAGYLRGGSSSYLSYGQSLVDETKTNNNGNSTKYVSVYEGSSSDEESNYKEEKNTERVGEAIWETSTSGQFNSSTSWFGDYSGFSYMSSPFLNRGGVSGSGTKYGLFYFNSYNGGTYSTFGFRAVLCKASYGTNGNTEEGVASVNAPRLVDGMEPIKFSTDVNGTAEKTNVNDPNWYAYKGNGSNFKTDNTTSHWANAQTADGSQWVWIPRYAYKIKYTNPEDKSQASPIDVIFLKGTGNTYIDTDGSVKTLTPDYIVHPVFRDETENGFANGGWDSELTGIWVAKYEASEGTGKENNSKKTYPKFVPGKDSYKNITTIGDMFTLCKNLAIDNNNPYKFNASETDTHQMKNSEWGAVAYLAQSKYGRNGVEVTQNKNSTTGKGTTSSDTYNTLEGQKASTTGNIYGIYDMSGGIDEYTAGYLNNGVSNLKNYGQSLLDETNNESNEKNKGTSTKYVSVYEASSGNDIKENYNINSERKGEAIWETSTSGYGYTSWFGEYIYCFSGSYNFSLRGGNFRVSDTLAGLFYFGSYDGTAYNFRAVCVSK